MLNTIRLEHITKHFDELTVLEDVCLEIKKGQTTTIMGASGAGKTTLLHLLLGIEKLERGHISGLEGEHVTAVFQENRLCEQFDAVTNVKMVLPHGFRESVIREHFNMVGLSEYEGKPAAKLSGGMKRRVAIVRAMLAESSVIIMDEPFKGLNETLKYQVMEYVKKQSENKTLIFVSHDKSEAEFFSAIVLCL